MWQQGLPWLRNPDGGPCLVLDCEMSACLCLFLSFSDELVIAEPDQATTTVATIQVRTSRAGKAKVWKQSYIYFRDWYPALSLLTAFLGLRDTLHAKLPLYWPFFNYDWPLPILSNFIVGQITRLGLIWSKEKDGESVENCLLPFSKPWVNFSMTSRLFFLHSSIFSP